MSNEHFLQKGDQQLPRVLTKERDPAGKADLRRLQNAAIADIHSALDFASDRLKTGQILDQDVRDLIEDLRADRKSNLIDIDDSTLEGALRDDENEKTARISQNCEILKGRIEAVLQARAA